MPTVNGSLKSDRGRRTAIVGMDVLFPGCDGLAALRRTIYKGEQHFRPAGAGRWEVAALSNLPAAGFLGSFSLNPATDGSLGALAQALRAEDWLLARVVRRALQDAARPAAGSRLKTALLAVRQTLTAGGQMGAQPQPLGMDHLDAVLPAEGWDFSAPRPDFSDAPLPVVAALEEAQKLLLAGEVEAVVLAAVTLIGDAHLPGLDGAAKTPPPASTLGFDRSVSGWTAGEGAAAVVLRRYEDAIMEGDGFYAALEAIGRPALEPQPAAGALVPESLSMEAVEEGCRRAFAQAGLEAAAIGYLEVVASGVAPLDAAEAGGLARAYRLAQPDLTCALGSMQAYLGYTFALGPLAGLIGAALCLSERMLPALPGWSAPRQPELWTGSPFYVPGEARPWFAPPAAAGRNAALNTFDGGGNCAHLILSEPASRRVWSGGLQEAGFYLFPLCGNDPRALQSELLSLKSDLESSRDLSALAWRYYSRWAARTGGGYTAALLAHDAGELRRELGFAESGIAKAFGSGGEWQTPLGSYFTAWPLGSQAGIAFVYPGAFNSSIGMGRDLFWLFPQLHEWMAAVAKDVGAVLQERRLYPRSQRALSKEELAALEAGLVADSVAMLLSGSSLSVLYTLILREVFGLQPAAAFGYSLGENSMLFASGIWRDGDAAATRLRASAVFRSRLSGPQNAIREYWGMPAQGDAHRQDDFWCNYLLMADPQRVREALRGEQRVYLTHINTPRQVVIGGEKDGCLRVISALQCASLRAPFDHALHCEAMRSEVEELRYLHSWPLAASPALRLYSAAGYRPLPLQQETIAARIAEMLCAPLDFPRLVETVYAEGARIFVEAGAGGNCARWIDETLKGRPHLAVSVQRGASDDLGALLRALGRLASHGVALDLAALYPPPATADLERYMLRAGAAGLRIVAADTD